MEIDVVIPTYNNNKLKKFSLYFTIRSILAQSVQPRNIIIVENCNLSETKKIIHNEFGKLVNIIDGTLIPENISFARNLGVKHGYSELIIFIDDDVVIGRNDTFEKIIKKMKFLDFYCAAERYWTYPDWNTYLERSFLINHIQHILYQKSFLPKSVDRSTGEQSFHEFTYIGHFGAIRRDVFEKNNGYDENYCGWSYQDTDLMMRLCADRYNFELMYLDNISVYHLAHAVDKSHYININKDLYLKKQKKLGIEFHLNHFFGIFNDDEYSILS
jgi:glycosyltransferase involved in cell wall biosynthesis